MNKFLHKNRFSIIGIFITFFCLSICIYLASCKSNYQGITNGYDAYEEGYADGYEEGLWDGVFECKKDFANAVRDRYIDVEGAASNGREFHAEEAIMILNDYLKGKYVSNSELNDAIESLSDFYYDWQNVVANIEDLDVDVYFD